MAFAVGVRGRKVPWRERFWEKVSRSDGCWEWRGALSTTGYGVIRGDAPRGTPANIRAHRAAWILSRGVPPPGLDVCHTCDNRTCVRPDHLFLGTRLDNMRDCRKKGRTLAGERSPHAKLTDETVLSVRQRRAAGEKARLIAADLGVTVNAIYQIAARKRWSHLR